MISSKNRSSELQQLFKLWDSLNNSENFKLQIKYTFGKRIKDLKSL